MSTGEPRIWLDKQGGTVDPAFAAEVRGVVEQGGGDGDIAEILGISVNVAKKVRHALGIRFRAPPAPMVPDARIRKLHAAGLRTREIASETGLTYRTAQQRMHRLGLKANRSGGAGPRDEHIHIRASASDLEHIRTQSEAAGMTASEWIRIRLGLTP